MSKEALSGFSEDHIESVIGQWQQAIAELDLEAEVGNTTPDIAEDGCRIYEWQPEGCEGATAIVDMRNVKVAAAEYHIDETELHIPITGKAKMVIGDEEIELEPGKVAVVKPETPHYVIPESGYVVAVVGIPGFDPDNLVPIEADTNIPEGKAFDKARYLGLVAVSGAEEN